MEWLIKKYVKNYKDVNNADVRASYGRVTSVVGILFNIFLFAIKQLAGLLIGSISIQADAINNLSDAASSVVSLISFKLASRPADKEHPYGHARYESIGAMIVAALILLLGIDLARTSFDKILHPALVEMNLIAILALVLSITVKIYMYFYNKKYGDRIDSTVMRAVAADSLSDSIATSAVLISLVIASISGLALDGYVGIIVAIFVFRSGIEIIKHALDEIIGKVPSKELIEELINFVKSYKGVLGTHDLMVHDYGPNRLFASVHVEVAADNDILESHDMIDLIERDVKEKLDINLVVHMDPIVVNDSEVIQLKNVIKEALKVVSEDLSFHDFRAVFGKTHNNVIFDIVIPYECDIDEKAIKDQIMNSLQQYDNRIPYYLIINFDRPYI